MANAYFKVPVAVNEPVWSYAPGSPERKELRKALTELKGAQVDIPMTIGGKKVYTDDKRAIYPPHEIKHQLGVF
ncbi:MAG: hypothetical protein LC127_02980 [Chitinophagales bacterium]|nr:hypothetical protein [Chitinophagales bacterium]